MIDGYRHLTEEEISAINALKDVEAKLGVVLGNMQEAVGPDGGAQRWIDIARTYLETGFMFAVKAVAKPTNGLGRTSNR